jgi:CheY-like chemotaxis protein/HPt (histidine-containing phosphotransfer) domain-containing protein
MYSQVSRENLEEIRKLWSAGDLEGLTLKFHALKSTSGVIGAPFLAESAAALEAAGRQGEPEKIQRGQIPDDDEPERSRPVQSAYDDEPEKTWPVQTVYDDELEKFLSAYEELTGKLSALFETGEAEPVGELPVGSTPEMSPETIDKASSKHILLVDDDPLYLKMVRSWLSDRYEVTALKSGKQALAYLQGHMVDLILLDFEMKDMDGSVILEHLRQNPSTGEIPVIFLTGRSDEEITSQISGPAPAGYLSKAMDKEQIVDAIDVFLISWEIPSSSL